MKRDWKSAAAAAVVLVVVGGVAYAIGTAGTAPRAVARPTDATLTVVGATATVYGARATETVIGAPMPLSDIGDTVVVVIEGTAGIASCEILAGGVRVAHAATTVGQQAVCIWNLTARGSLTPPA
jgi:hypothetical protein